MLIEDASLGGFGLLPYIQKLHHDLSRNLVSAPAIVLQGKLLYPSDEFLVQPQLELHVAFHTACYLIPADNHMSTEKWIDLKWTSWYHHGPYVTHRTRFTVRCP